MATPKMKSQELRNQENNTKLKKKNSHPQIKYFCHTSKGSPHGETFEKTQPTNSIQAHHKNTTNVTVSTEGTPSPLQEYTGYLAVVARYILEPQNEASTAESKTMKDTAD